MLKNLERAIRISLQQRDLTSFSQSVASLIEDVVQTTLSNTKVEVKIDSDDS